MDPARQYALKLHALLPADREWILAQLTSETQDRLRPLLDELKSLGFRVDQHLLDSLVERNEAEPTAVADDSDAHLRNVRLLETADPQWIASALKGEPQIVRSAIEGAHPWPWLAKRNINSTSGDPRSSAPAHHLGPSHRARAALVAHLARQMLADGQAGRGDVYAVPGSGVPSTKREPGKGKWLPWRR